MNPPPRQSFSITGSTLIEAVITIGILALVIPLVYGTMAEAGKCGMAAGVETRCICMVPACMDEIHASREGHPRYFAATTVGQTFPPAGEVWALAFSVDGKPVGKLSKTLYDQGTRELNGKPVSYIASLSTSSNASASNISSPALEVRIAISYPAAAPAPKRRSLEFNTRMP